MARRFGHFDFVDTKEKVFDREHNLLTEEERKRKKIEENMRLLQPWKPEEERKAPQFIPYEK